MPADKFSEALQGKKLPILVLDNKWYKLLSGLDKPEEMRDLEMRLRELLKRQGKLNNDTKRIRKQKNALMNEIVNSMDTQNSEDIKQNSKQQIEQLNQAMEEYQNELLELPRQIEEANYELMLMTMKLCYGLMKENTEEVQRISEWISQTRVELKKKIVIKQEKEIRNEIMYSYMHDIFGAQVIDMFDLQYNPEKEHLVRTESEIAAKKAGTEL